MSYTCLLGPVVNVRDVTIVNVSEALRTTINLTFADM